MYLNFPRVCLVLVSLSTSSLYALQTLVMQNEEILIGQISNDEPNRITVKNDRILEVKLTDVVSNYKNSGPDPLMGPPNKREVYLDQNPDLGDIYIKPVYADNRDPINLFITTERNHSFSLSLKPADMGPQTVLIIPPGTTANVSTAAAWEAQAPYEQTLVNLIKVMRLQESIEGYQMEYIENEPVKKSAQEGVQLRLITRYQGDALLGEVYELANYTTSTYHVVESQIFSDFGRDLESLAVAATSKNVPSATFTHIYRVVPL